MKVEYTTDTSTNAAPLAVFRALFGLMMLGSIIRFWANGWIHDLYIEPQFFFSYDGFEWVKPIGSYTYLIFGICGLAAIGVALGAFYRISAPMFFLSFTYIELMDKTTYLNHYYFVSVVSFLLIWLPANCYWSVDARRFPAIRSEFVPRWTIDSIKLMLGIVYFYAGLAKLNSDWLLHAQPLATWLSAKTSLPIIGAFMDDTWVHFACSWFGAVYDLSIPFLLLNKRTRPLAFFLVVVFHIMTRILFPIGMFPFIMILSTLIFAAPRTQQKWLNAIHTLLKMSPTKPMGGPVIRSDWNQKRSGAIVGILLAVQLLLPWRYLFYPGELFWTEEGFRFSWRVMLMEKAGYASFKVVEPASGKSFIVDNGEFLSPFQEKQMSFQPDFILQYAIYLNEVFQKRGIVDPEIYVESYVGLNGRSSQPYVREDLNLLTISPSHSRNTWLYPFDDEIFGL